MEAKWIASTTISAVSLRRLKQAVHPQVLASNTISQADSSGQRDPLAPFNTSAMRLVASSIVRFLGSRPWPTDTTRQGISLLPPCPQHLSASPTTQTISRRNSLGPTV